jgi:hypothetical protein
MGMAMGHGMMPNVPIGVPPPAMQGLLMPPTGQMMHQQMIGGVPQPVNSPFNAGREYFHEHMEPCNLYIHILSLSQLVFIYVRLEASMLPESDKIPDD